MKLKSQIGYAHFEKIDALKLDGNGVGTSVRYDDDSQVLANELRLQYKRILSTGELTLGAESFFFQEGQAQIYQRARYGVLRVDGTDRDSCIGDI